MYRDNSGYNQYMEVKALDTQPIGDRRPNAWVLSMSMLVVLSGSVLTVLACLVIHEL